MFFKKLLNWLLPYTCVLCKTLTRSTLICHGCLQDLPILPQGCPSCARILADTNGLCGECLRESPPFERMFALFDYQPPVVKLLLNLKFQHALVNGRLFGELMAKNILQDWYADKALPAVIIPVPLHTKRLRKRGFNQAIEITRPIAKATGLPVWLNVSRRIKSTVTQTTLSAAERRKNMRGAFVVEKNLENLVVAVIDDVVTTGSTVHEFCRTLKKQGAKEIHVWCVARRQKNHLSKK